MFLVESGNQTLGVYLSTDLKGMQQNGHGQQNECPQSHGNDEFNAPDAGGERLGVDLMSR